MARFQLVARLLSSDAVWPAPHEEKQSERGRSPRFSVHASSAVIGETCIYTHLPLVVSVLTFFLNKLLLICQKDSTLLLIIVTIKFCFWFLMGVVNLSLLQLTLGNTSGEHFHRLLTKPLILPQWNHLFTVGTLPFVGGVMLTLLSHVSYYVLCLRDFCPGSVQPVSRRGGSPVCGARRTWRHGFWTDRAPAGSKERVWERSMPQTIIPPS